MSYSFTYEDGAMGLSDLFEFSTPFRKVAAFLQPHHFIALTQCSPHLHWQVNFSLSKTGVSLQQWVFCSNLGLPVRSFVALK